MECHERLTLLVEQMKAGAGITEELKARDQVKWVGLMNNVRSVAEEAVIRELIPDFWGECHNKNLVESIRNLRQEGKDGYIED